MAREIMESKDMIRMKSEELFTAGMLAYYDPHVVLVFP